MCAFALISYKRSLSSAWNAAAAAGAVSVVACNVRLFSVRFPPFCCLPFYFNFGFILLPWSNINHHNAVTIILQKEKAAAHSICASVRARLFRQPFAAFIFRWKINQIHQNVMADNKHFNRLVHCSYCYFASKHFNTFFQM